MSCGEHQSSLLTQHLFPLLLGRESLFPMGNRSPCTTWPQSIDHITLKIVWMIPHWCKFIHIRMLAYYALFGLGLPVLLPYILLRYHQIIRQVEQRPKKEKQKTQSRRGTLEEDPSSQLWPCLGERRKYHDQREKENLISKTNSCKFAGILHPNTIKFLGFIWGLPNTSWDKEQTKYSIILHNLFPLSFRCPLRRSSEDRKE